MPLRPGPVFYLFDNQIGLAFVEIEILINAWCTWPAACLKVCQRGGSARHYDGFSAPAYARTVWNGGNRHRIHLVLRNSGRSWRQYGDCAVQGSLQERLQSLAGVRHEKSDIGESEDEEASFWSSILR